MNNPPFHLFFLFWFYSLYGRVIDVAESHQFIISQLFVSKFQFINHKFFAVLRLAILGINSRNSELLF